MTAYKKKNSFELGPMKPETLSVTKYKKQIQITLVQLNVYYKLLLVFIHISRTNIITLLVYCSECLYITELA